MELTKSRKSSKSKNSTRYRPRKTSKLETYDSDEYNEEDDEKQFSINYSDSIDSASLANSHKTLFSNFNSDPIINDKFVNIAPFPIFKGTNKECPFIHLSRFQKVCLANNVFSIQSMIRIFPITLEDEAALWFDLNVEPYPSLSWDEIKSSFLEAYRNDNFDVQLKSMKQGDDESVRSYFLRLQWLLKIWPDHGLTEYSVIRVFIDGLKREIRDWVLTDKPNSIGNALSIAFDIEKLGDCEIRGKMRDLMFQREGGRLGEEREAGGLEWEKKQNNVVERENEGREMKKSQCQCSKHRCGKKRIERSDSVATAKSINFS